MPTALLMRMEEYGAIRLVSIPASMIAAFVRYALSANRHLDSALSCFEAHAEDLPLAHRDYACPPHWPGDCMAGALKRTVDGDLSLWPRSLRAAVAAAVDAARGAIAAERPRRVQAAAYAASKAALFAGDINRMLCDRLARQIGTAQDAPIVTSLSEGFRSLPIRAAFLALRGATNAICCGARMQTEGAVCAFCEAAPDSLIHFGRCQGALVPFCRALDVPPADSILAALERAPSQAPRLWAAFSDFVWVIAVSRA